MRTLFRTIMIVYLSSVSTAFAALTLQNGLSNPYPAPQLQGLAWINSKPLQINQLKGKVVLIDFWTYSCINCIRTLPYLKDWYSKYHNAGFEIIGVHTPEFDFEKNLDNVKRAVAEDGIKYPVVLDSDFQTWENYHNQYWPAHYLLNKDGQVVYQHFGEGDYDVTENNIRFLLGMTTPITSVLAPQASFSPAQTPETYLGFGRAESFSSPQSVTQNEPAQYTFPDELPNNGWALSGTWTIDEDRVVASQANAAVKIHFNARNVFIVMGSATGKPIRVHVMLDGEDVTKGEGSNLENSSVIVSNHTLYQVLALPHADSGILQITTSSPGLEVYTFTFGG